MSDPTPEAAGSTPPPRPRTPGWVKLLLGLAAIGADVTESILHPEVAAALAIAEVAIPVIVGLIVFTTIVLGSQETADRVFRLLRWIRNHPEPLTPGSSSSQSPAGAAEHTSAQVTVGISPAGPVNPSPSASSDLIARQAAMLYEFDIPSEQGLNRDLASTAFKKYGLDPRSLGVWVQGGYLAHEENRRWLTDKGRQWAYSKSGGVAATRPGRRGWHRGRSAASGRSAAPVRGPRRTSAKLPAGQASVSRRGADQPYGHGRPPRGSATFPGGRLRYPGSEGVPGSR